MSQSSYPITGIPLVPGKEIPVRREITAWYDDEKNKYQVSLFMHALEILKDRPVEDQFSFYQVAGIHCYPLVGWDGDMGRPHKINPKDPFPGYCNHNMVTFPTWHRPYMLLYEQLLYEIMSDLVDKKWQIPTSEVTNWKDAASQFRLPYWDWARKQEYAKNFAIPQVCTLDTVKVLLPGNKSREMSNPLAGFRNPKRNASGKSVPMGDPTMGKYAIKDDTAVPAGSPPLPWSKCSGISRYGILSDKPESEWSGGINNWKSANAGIADPQWYGQGSGSLGDAVNRLLSPGYFSSWETFASTAHNNPSSATNFMSLEFIHNVVHNASGGLYMSAKDAEGGKGFKGLGLGHMSDVPVAGFDPIFYFHHCNIDRLAAIWQTLNWDMWFDHYQLPDPSPKGPLAPFHYDTARNTYTSDKVRDWTKLNYQYDDLVVQPSAKNPDGSIDKVKYLLDVRAHVDQLYPGTSKIVKQTAGYTFGNENFNDYVINVVYDRYALKGRAYAILFFIGEPPAVLSDYPDHENFVGQVYTFSAPIENSDGTTACGNCATQSDGKVLSKAHIPITLQLLAKAGRLEAGIPGAGLGALDPEPVQEILRQQLTWEFVELGGKRRDKADFPNTEIAVLHGQGRHATAGHPMARYQGYRKLTAATQHRMLGSGPSGLIKDDGYVSNGNGH